MADVNDELLAQFQDITGADVERSQFFLESSNWNLEMALGSFFENEAGGGPAEVEMGDEAGAAVAAGAAAPTDPPAAEPPKPSPARPAGRGNIFLESDDDDSDSDMEEGQAYYAGGSETSGQQILGPPKKKDGRDFVKEMFKKAREHGAEAVDPSSMGASSSSRSAFVGTGFRLGSTEIPSQPIGKPSDAATAQPKPREFTLKMWRNGFSIDDGDLRGYDDPQNREFLVSVMAGRIPKELINEAKGGEVHVNMEDHKEEEFKKPKASVKPFQGSGFVLGSVVPSVAGESSSSAAAASAPVSADKHKELEESAQREIGVNANEASTTIQIRMPDGRLQAKLNHSHTVGDLRRYIRLARPNLAAANFSLLTTFPNKELTDDSQNLKDAGLINAAILLRIK